MTERKEEKKKLNKISFSTNKQSEDKTQYKTVNVKDIETDEIRTYEIEKEDNPELLFVLDDYYWPGTMLDYDDVSNPDFIDYVNAVKKAFATDCMDKTMINEGKYYVQKIYDEDEGWGEIAAPKTDNPYEVKWFEEEHAFRSGVNYTKVKVFFVV